jgi:glycine/D-amino acid oxidase-like deaminating enzyme
VDVEEELAQELEAAKRSAAGSSVQASENARVLKVQCQHGSVLIRQGGTANFEELLAKFVKYAVEKGWCTENAKCTLQFDGDDVDVSGNTPEGLGINDGEVLDVLIA